MNELKMKTSDNSTEDLLLIIDKISQLQEMPTEVIKKLVSAQGSLKKSRFAEKISESKNNS